MSLITAVEYDECRSWIKKKRNKGISWEKIRFAEKGTVDGLKRIVWECSIKKAMRSGQMEKELMSKISQFLEGQDLHAEL